MVVRARLEPAREALLSYSPRPLLTYASAAPSPRATAPHRLLPGADRRICRAHRRPSRGDRAPEGVYVLEGRGVGARRSSDVAGWQPGRLTTTVANPPIYLKINYINRGLRR